MKHFYKEIAPLQVLGRIIIDFLRKTDAHPKSFDKCSNMFMTSKLLLDITLLITSHTTDTKKLCPDALTESQLVLRNKLR